MHFLQASKYLKISTCPASRKLLAYMGKNEIFTRNIKYLLALQPEALVNTSGRVLFSSPVFSKAKCRIIHYHMMSHLRVI